jgi:hypothetical protein
MHGGSARLAQSVPVRETFEGKTVWEGVVHVFDLTVLVLANRGKHKAAALRGAAYRAGQLAPRSSAGGDCDGTSRQRTRIRCRSKFSATSDVMRSPN